VCSHYMNKTDMNGTGTAKRDLSLPIANGDVIRSLVSAETASVV
jgi:hypothetical protein